MASTKVIVAATVTSLLAFNLGAVAGALYMKSKLGKEFDERLEKELFSAKKRYSRLYKKDDHDISTVNESEMLPIERDAAAAMVRYQGNNTIEETPAAEPEYYERAQLVTENNIFNTSNRGEENLAEYEELIKNRNENSPYVITVAEYMNNEREYGQDALVYFKGDAILVDDRDEVVADIDGTVGDDNLTLFGHFSGDDKIVYVRSDRLQHDWEIVAHEGKYAYVVLGFADESETESESDPVTTGS